MFVVPANKFCFQNSLSKMFTHESIINKSYPKFSWLHGYSPYFKFSYSNKSKQHNIALISSLPLRNVRYLGPALRPLNKPVLLAKINFRSYYRVISNILLMKLDLV